MRPIITYLVILNKELKVTLKHRTLVVEGKVCSVTFLCFQNLCPRIKNYSRYFIFIYTLEIFPFWFFVCKLTYSCINKLYSQYNVFTNTLLFHPHFFVITLSLLKRDYIRIYLKKKTMINILLCLTNFMGTFTLYRTNSIYKCLYFTLYLDGYLLL